MEKRLKDKVKMPVPEDTQLMDFEPQDNEDSTSVLDKVSDDELLNEFEKRGLTIDDLQKRDANVEVPQDNLDLGL